MPYRSRKIQKRIWVRRRIAILSTLVAIVLLMTGFLVYRNFSKGGNTFSSNVSLPFYKEHSYASNSKNVFYIKNGELHGINKKAKDVFSVSQLSHGNKVAAGEQYVATFDDSGYQLFDMKGKEKSKKEGNVQLVDLRLSDSHVAIQIKEGDKSYIYIYDADGKEKNKTEIDASRLMDFGVVDAQTSLWTLSVSLKSTQPVSQYTSYNFTKNSVTSVINITDQLAEKILLSGSYAYVIGTNNIVSYTQTGKKEDSYLVYGWRLADYKFSANKPAYVLVPRNDGEAKIKNMRIRHSDNSEYTFTLQDECFDAMISGEKIFSFGNDAVFVNDLKGNALGKDSLPFAFRSIHPVMNNTCIIADDGNQFSLIGIK